MFSGRDVGQDVVDLLEDEAAAGGEGVDQSCGTFWRTLVRGWRG